jgi:hypothetical protein
VCRQSAGPVGSAEIAEAAAARQSVGFSPHRKRVLCRGHRRILALVARGRTPERRDRLVDRPSDVRVTVIVVGRNDRRRRTRRDLGNCSRTRGVTRCLAGLAAVAVLAGAAVGELADSGITPRHGRPAAARILAEAAAYRFPLGCLGATLSRRSSSRASNATALPCWHYGVYVTAVFRRVYGVWRLMLAARSDSCPSVPLPAAIRALLVACSKNDIRVVRSPGAAVRPEERRRLGARLRTMLNCFRQPGVNPRRPLWRPH